MEISLPEKRCKLYNAHLIHTNHRAIQIMQEYIDFFTGQPMLSVAWIAIAGMLINSLIQSKISKVTSVTPAETVTLMNKENAVVVDVRSTEDFKKGHILNAKNIPVGEIDKGSFSAIEKDKKSPIIMVCDSGTRSAGAAKKLVAAGFENVSNLATGINGWKSGSFPTTKK